MVVGVLLALCLTCVMATALVAEAPHEYLGVACIVLAVIHIVQNRRWIAGVAKGRQTPVRVLQLISVIGMAICLLGQLVSALILSKYAFGFLPVIEGASWGRTVHLLCSYWLFVFAAAHVGLNFKTMMAHMGARSSAGPKEAGGASAVVWATLIIWVIVSIFGVVSFVQMGIAGYLFGLVPFASADFDAPLILIFIRYAAIGALIAGIFHCIRLALSGKEKHGRA